MRKVLSLALISSLAAPQIGCAAQPGDAVSDPATAEPTPARGPTDLRPLAEALDVRAASTGEAESATAGRGRPRPEVVEIMAIVGAAMTIYDTYKQISGMIASLGTTQDPTAQIMQALGDLKSRMVQIDAEIQQLDQQLENLAYQDRRAYYLQTLQNVQTLEAQAQTASQQLTDWVQTGKSNAFLLADADNNSQMAANALKASSFYYRPASTVNAPDIFDLRQVIVSYLYALTVRMTVVAMEHPSFRNDSGYRDEFRAHLAWLQQIPGLNAPNVQRWSVPTLSGSYFQACSRVTDANSGYQSILAGEYPGPYNPLCTGWRWGGATEENETLSFFQYWDNWYVEEEMGIHAAQKVADLVAVDATTPILWIWPVPSNGYNSLGPLVSNAGQCLTVGSHGLDLESCAWGSGSQTWQTAGQTGTSTAALKDASACLEVPDWEPGFVAGTRPCSTSPGEQFNVTNANELRWGRDASYCLTAVSGSPQILKCDGQPHQKWGRSWPAVILPHPRPGL